MQLATFGDFHFGTKLFFDNIGKWLDNIPTIGQDAPNSLQIDGVAAEGKQSAFAVDDIGRRDGDGVEKALRIDGDVALDSRDFLPAVATLFARAIRVLDALRVDDQKLVEKLRPCFVRASLTTFFKACSRTLNPSGPSSLHLAK